MKLIVYKSKKILEVWEGSQLLKSYDIAIGKDERGHKEREGDMRTPEGRYVVCAKNPNSSYHLSFALNYPNNEDAKSGLENRLISEEEFHEICKANDAGKVPLWKTTLGGEIYVHGNLEKQNWSQGCIRLNDADIEVLYTQIKIGTSVTILP